MEFIPQPDHPVIQRFSRQQFEALPPRRHCVSPHILEDGWRQSPTVDARIYHKAQFVYQPELQKRPIDDTPALQRQAFHPEHFAEFTHGQRQIATVRACKQIRDIAPPEVLQINSRGRLGQDGHDVVAPHV